MHLHRRGTWLPVRVFKRLVEVLVALVTLVALLPLVRGARRCWSWSRPAVSWSGQPRVDERGRTVTVPAVPHPPSRGRWRRRGTTFSVAISGRTGPVGRLLRRTGLDALPELVWALLRRVRYAGGVPGGSTAVGSERAYRPRRAPTSRR